MKGKFRTGYSVKDCGEMVLDAKVAANMSVGTLVTLTEANGVYTIAAAANLGAATHIVAQSDMTLEYGHVPVENRNYAYSDTVAASTAIKRVALFRISDKNDIIAY